MDIQDIEDNKLWMQLSNGSLVNMNADPKTFDEAVLSFGIPLIDRVNWPLFHRYVVLNKYIRTVPVCMIPEDQLTEAQKNEVARIRGIDDEPQEETGKG